MKTSTLGAVLLSAGLLCASLPAAAEPDNRWNGGPDHRDWDAAHSYDGKSQREREIRHDEYVHRGSDGRYYCRRNDGTTGLVIGGLGGAAIGGAIGGDTLGALLGGASGALLGRHIDREKVHCR